MITFDAVQKTLKLDTPNSSYVIGIHEERYLLNLYYGAYLPDNNLWGNAVRAPFASFSPRNPHIDSFSPDTAPMEYGCNGSGDMRISALSVRNCYGNTTTDIRYVSHRIYPGKPDLSPLPHIYLNSDDEADTLEILTEDSVTGAQAFLYYTVFSRLDVITRSVKIMNNSREPMDIERAFSMNTELPAMDFDLITLYGTWNKERTREKRRLVHGIQTISSKRGSSSHMHNPFAALLRHGAGEEQGDAYGFSLIYSGNFEISAECNFQDTTRIIAGINPADFGWHLEPGKCFQTPEAVMVYTDKGLGEMSRIFHRLINNNLIRGRDKTEKRPLHINNWEATHCDFDGEKLFSIAQCAGELGIEMLVMDDGWFGKRNDPTTSLGDWYPNAKKFPDGLDNLIKRIHALGLKFGIWFEPEMVSPDSDLFRAHPDWIVHCPNREPCIARDQYVLDMSRADVRDYLFGTMHAFLLENPVDYIKWDFNRNLSDAASALLPPERQKEFFHRYVLGTYDLMDRLTRAFPEILLENCSGGGGRFDGGMLYYSPQIQTSDNTDPIERLTIQFGTSLCYPASAMGSHVSASHRTGYETKGNVALWGDFGYELDPTELSETDREIVRNQVRQYHKYYHLIQSGDLYRLIDPNDDPYKCAWSFVAPDKSEVLAAAVIMRENHKTRIVLKLAGLEKNRYYRNEGNGEIYSGALLMNAGIDLTNVIRKDGESVLLHFTSAN